MSERTAGPTGSRIVVAIVSYRRPEPLRRTVQSVQGAASLAQESGHAVRILVVDNDPALSAHPVCEELGVEVVGEPVPGIAAARNRALAMREPDECLAFIDDDEEAGATWVLAHLTALARPGSSASFGPVHPRFQDDAPGWVTRGGFFDRRHATSDGSPVHPATNNVMIAASVLTARPTIRFSEEFSLTGGSDTDFFARLRSHGGISYVWCEDAVVDEDIPSSRATARWLWRRNLRLGNVAARVRLAGSPRPVIAAVGAARVLVGVGLTLVAVVTRRRLAPALTHVPKGIGMMQWAAGRTTVEYARPSANR